MKRFVLKQMGADHTWCRACGAVWLVGSRSALSGNTNVNASFQKALYFDHFWNSCAGIVSALRVLGFLDPYERPMVRIVRLATGPTSVRGSTCPFVKLASATAVQGWRPKFDMHIYQPGKRYKCARLASIDVAQRAWTCPRRSSSPGAVRNRNSTVRNLQSACRLITFRNRTSLPIWRQIMVPVSSLGANQSLFQVHFQEGPSRAHL
jgi:hypothetical protein